MKFHWALSLLAAASSVTAESSQKISANRLIEAIHGPRRAVNPTEFRSLEDRSADKSKPKPKPHPRFLNSHTKKFAVNGTGLPEVDFDVGESYSGLLPISNKTNERDHLFFWFFPTVNEEHQKDKEITIWLNGGPGCSSLLGFLQENGPFLWQPGTIKPQPNPWSWHLLTNVVWIEQPVGVGYSQGEPSITNEDELAAQFMGFWRNFIDTFSLQGWKVYIAAESYGGYYGPYISSNFLDAKDKEYYNLKGLIVYDGIMFDGNVQSNVPTLQYVTRHKDEFAFDDATLAKVKSISDGCGFTDYFEKYLTFPPSGVQPIITPGLQVLPNGTIAGNETCYDFWNYVTEWATEANPCFNVYNILDHCPFPYDPLGDEPYFDRADVKKALHAPAAINWTQCINNPFNSTDGSDQSPPPGLKQLPHVIDATQNVILAQGAVDWILVLNGVILGVQNMTWGGKTGFQTQPQDPFYVPLYGFDPFGSGGYASNLPAGSGVQGTTHHERGLTLVATQLAGHEGPQYAAASAFRHLEKLLGRVKSLSGTEPFTLPELRNVTQLKASSLGKGIVPIP
ncbi:serine-type carboxypeptidase [Trichoderma arundinaceum]|uniref:Carboxypeptidase n=1 Tax=Trichoderma arundinaceum TaxID=490622 RepID=A0A395N7M8_TRIAR|nr:serine-type carboxypeptidase [Trichoderma arundinaceum]